MMRPSFIMLVGLPGSGKSTYVADLGFRCLSSDVYVEEIASARGLTYNDCWADHVKYAEKCMFDDIAHAVAAGESFAVDRTNLTPKSRARILRLIPDHYMKIAIYFEIDEILRQERIANRPGKTIPTHVDKGMRDSYVRPTFSEGFNLVSAAV